jgi:hypothetical protein
MNPKGVKVRESRDGPDHPESQGIVFALDVSGSMGEIPKLMATQQLPSFMKVLMDCQIRDPQILFMAIGNATSDKAPLQVGQFESTAELMDQWLTWTYLEGRGGGLGESYDLGFYFLATHTEMDCMVKRNKRGYLFMTGDEPPFPALSRHIVEGIIGDKLDEDRRDLLGDHVLCLESPVDVCFVAAGAILLSEKRASNIKELTELLSRAGMPSNRRSQVIQSLTPFAEVTLGTTQKPGWFSRLFS